MEINLFVILNILSIEIDIKISINNIKGLLYKYILN